VTALYMITGPAGSGKTTFGLALAERLGAASLDLDDVTSGLVADFRARRPDVTEAEALRLLREDRYSLLAACARDLLGEADLPALVLIAPFTAETSSPARWQAWIDSLGIPAERARLIWLSLTPEERLRRLSSRGASRDSQVVAEADLPEPTLPAVPAIILDASGPLEVQLQGVMQRFGNG